MKLQVLAEDRLAQFKADMKAAFRFGAHQGMGTDEEVLPEDDLLSSLNAEGAIAYIATEQDEMVGGAIVVIDTEKQINHLDFLYVIDLMKCGEESICPFCGGNVRMTVAEENHTVFACDCCDMSIDLKIPSTSWILCSSVN